MKNIITSSICCDILLPINNYKRFVHLLTKASENPQWLRHSFVVITNGISAQDEKAMQDWYYENRVKKPMPNVSIIKARDDAKGNISSLYMAAMVAGDNPFVYFQDEKDELPVNIDKSIYYLVKNPQTDILIGKCETFLEDGTPIEVFPMSNIKGQFLYSCEEATKLFPSYLHPLSSVMRKEVFNKISYSDASKKLTEFAYYSFALRALEQEDVKVEYVSYTIKISTRQREHAITMGPKMRQRLVKSIKIWVEDLPEGPEKEFQVEIMHLMERGEITTFKEIDARIEDYLDSKK